MNPRVTALLVASFLNLESSPAFGASETIDWFLGLNAAPQPVEKAAPVGAIDPSAVQVANLRFWVDVYSQYGVREGLLHDSKYVQVVYEKFMERAGVSRRPVAVAREYYRSILLSLNEKEKQPETWTPEERRVAELFQNIDEPNKFLHAAHRKRLRYQQGQRENYLSGLVQSGRYLPQMEEIFRREGLPVELTRLPFVESSFNTKARSKVGASGIFQFMPSTGRLFLKIDDSIDERNDPIRAAEAAAKLLKQNYESLGSWPLAVTAYNHGRIGVMNAVRRVGSTDLREIVRDYRTRSFGFASGNFYVELLAAIELERNPAKYFGVIERERPEATFDFVLPHYVYWKDLIRFFRLPGTRLEQLNPGVTELTRQGKRRVPAGYRLRLPIQSDLSVEGAERVFRSLYEKLPVGFKYSAQVLGQTGFRSTRARNL